MKFGSSRYGTSGRLLVKVRYLLSHHLCNIALPISHDGLFEKAILASLLLVMNIYDYVYAQDAVGTGLYVGKSEGKRGWGGEVTNFLLVLLKWELILYR